MAATPEGRTPQLEAGSPLAGTPYRILRLIGAGGFGEVYEAEHEELGVRRALKVLLPHASGAERVARMRAEARALARLRHPCIVEVMDLGTAEDGRSFLAMELLAGAPLRDVLHNRGALPPEEAVHVALGMLDGLSAAHGVDLVHRDVKPENVFVCEDGSIRLLDFGVAKFLSGDAAFTQSGVSLGTPRYMAPEQVQGEPVDLRTDLYAVGVVLYELLSGRPPFEDDQLIALAYAHVMRPPPPLSDPPVPAALAAVVARALEKQPAARFASAPEFAAALKSAVAGAEGARGAARAALARAATEPRAGPALRRRRVAHLAVGSHGRVEIRRGAPCVAPPRRVGCHRRGGAGRGAGVGVDGARHRAGHGCRGRGGAHDAGGGRA